MIKEKFSRTKPHINVGTIGYSAHGKTTLTAAILKLLAKQKLAQALTYNEVVKGGQAVSENRTITIPVATVEYESPKRHYAHLDCPGHTDYCTNLINGAAQMDGAILVVAASDGVLPQTSEQVLLARQMGINYIVVFLNKCDEVEDPEMLDLVEMEIRELLSKHKFDGGNTPVIRGAALPALQDDPKWEAAIAGLLEAMDSYIPAPPRNLDKPLLLAVAEVIPVEGIGTAAIGRIERGVVKVGDAVEIVGFQDTKTGTVLSVEIFAKLIDPGESGDHVYCLLKGMPPPQLKRGQVLAKPGSITPHTKFLAELYFLKTAEGGREAPFSTLDRPQFYVRTAEVTGSVALPAGVAQVMPGDNVTLEITLSAPIATEEQMRFAIRECGRTIGAGIVTKIIA